MLPQITGSRVDPYVSEQYEAAETAQGMSVRRAVFRCSFIHEFQSRGPVIASVAVGINSSAVYIGLSDGSLEEHKVVKSTGCLPRLVLTARKHVGQKVVPKSKQDSGVRKSRCKSLLSPAASGEHHSDRNVRGYSCTCRGSG